MTKRSELTEALSAGRQALRRGDTTSARLEFQRALAIRPGYGPALAGLGEVHFELGQYNIAAAKLRAATRAVPGSVRTWVLLGNAYFRAGRIKAAKRAYERALKLRPGHAEAKRNLKLVRKRLGGM
jgi:Flp pilus assembly protein TadD